MRPPATVTDPAPSRASSRRRSRRGSQFVEAGLALVPFCAVLFLVVDTAWGLWVKATLQHAVREGVRYGITGRTAGDAGQIASIKAVVQNQAMGLLSGDRASTLFVRFYDPATLAATGSNSAGNVLEVAVEGYPVTPLAPLLRSASVFSLTVRAADIIEPSPGGVAPAL